MKKTMWIFCALILSIGTTLFCAMIDVGIWTITLGCLAGVTVLGKMRGIK